ncbi:MAG: RidA family protein [Eubacteriales bacterium]
MEKKLRELGLELPEPTQPVAAYVPTVRVGNLVFCSGQICTVKGELAFKGKIGAELSVPEGYEAAKIAVLNCLSAIVNEIGSLDRIVRIVKLTGWVNSVSGFVEQPFVINGASELLEKIFGDKGKHTRVAISANGLPLDSPVEIDMIVEVETP